MSLFLLEGCDWLNSDSTLGRVVVFQNDTSETVDILNVIDGVEWKLKTLEPDETYRVSADQFADGCLSGPFVARVADGTLIARHDARLCSGDRWDVAVGVNPSGS